LTAIRWYRSPGSAYRRLGRQPETGGNLHARTADWPEFIANFSGSNRYVIDYLIDEVYGRNRKRCRTSLCRTSIPERFCAPLCEYVVSGSQDLDIIDYLDRIQSIFDPIDDHREWFRYHHLFADFLSQRLVKLNETQSGTALPGQPVV